ncbi:hypothetical protein GCM10010420_44840 [Streptomyces glaucosporus]|uniref:Uncharacterized protein n=1 Tax=Streptomyces glaucosporus TaxID=284044 RepID=A0ABP5VSZ5_9ACTN
MARSADIDFNFGAPVSVSEVLHSFLRHGFLLTHRGLVSYVLDDDGMYDWKKADGSRLEEVIAIGGNSDPERTSFGISLFLGEHGTGGDLLFHRGRKRRSFMIEVNRRTVSRSSRFCDFGWYLERMVPVMEPLGMTELVARDSA